MYTDYLDLDSSVGRRVSVLPVPYEATASFCRGTREGPAAILRASREIETWDQRLRVDLAELAHFRTLPAFHPPASGPARMYEDLLDWLETELDPTEDFLLTLGGEHSVALAPAAFYARAHPEMVVLHLDAHADLRQSFESTPYSHACVMARIRELGPSLIQLGIRSLCREEADRIATSARQDIWTVFAWDLGQPEELARQTASFVGSRPVYLTFDADALDPSIMPGTGTPEPGGMSFEWLRVFAETFFPSVRLMGMDCCEVSPLPGGVLSESVAVKCINTVLTSALKEPRLRPGHGDGRGGACPQQ